MLVCWYSVADIPCYAVAITDQLDAYLQPRSHSDLISIITESLTVLVQIFARVSCYTLFTLTGALSRVVLCAMWLIAASLPMELWIGVHQLLSRPLRTADHMLRTWTFLTSRRICFFSDSVLRELCNFTSLGILCVGTRRILDNLAHPSGYRSSRVALCGSHLHLVFCR